MIYKYHYHSPFGGITLLGDKAALAQGEKRPNENIFE